MFSQALSLFGVSARLAFLILPLLLSACGGGERGFVALEQEEDEPEVSTYFDLGAVKGPLSNAKVNVYTLDLNAGQLGLHGDASAGLLALLNDVGASFVDGELRLPSQDPAASLAQFKTNFARYAYVGELPGLRQRLANSDSLQEARTHLDDLLEDNSSSDPNDRFESNRLFAEQLKTVNERYGSLAQLQRLVTEAKSFAESAAESTSLAGLASLINDAQNAEQNPLKQAGWQAISAQVSELQERQSSVSGLISDVRDLLDSVRADADLATDKVALERLENLLKDLAEAQDLAGAEASLYEAWRAEGNASVRLSLKRLLNSLVSEADGAALIKQASALYYFDGFAELVERTTSLEDLVTQARTLFASDFTQSLQEAFVNPIKNERDQALNLLGSVNSGATSIVTGINLRDYQGFVYIEVESDQGTRDLNTNAKPLIPAFSTIIHTDQIRGYGDNAREDRRVVFLRDGVELRDDKGKLIQRIEDVEGGNTGVVARYEQRFASPLSDLGLGLARAELAKFNYPFEDADGDGLPEGRLTPEALTSSLKRASAKVAASFALSDEPAFDLFTTPMLLTSHLKAKANQQTLALRLRSANEYYAALVVEVGEKMRLSSAQSVQLLTQDLSDGEFDGLEVDRKLTEFDMAYLATRPLDQVMVPGTSKAVAQVTELVRAQLATVDPSFSAADLTWTDQSLVLPQPIGGQDSDGDGVFDNTDALPNDASKTRDIPANYQGLWDVKFASEQVYTLPIDRPLSLQFSQTIAQGPCGQAPCYSVGNAATPLTQSYQILAQPSNGDLVLGVLDTSGGSNGEVGVTVRASVPGEYVVRASLSSELAPRQQYRYLMRFKVIDTRNLSFRLNPTIPLVGQNLSVEFELSQALCEALPIAAAQACQSINFDDEQADWGDISWWGAYFELDVRRNDETLTQLAATKSNNLNFNRAQTRYGDQLALDIYTGQFGARSLVSRLSARVGLANSQNANGVEYADADGDGVADSEDAFPLDAACSRANEGTLDSDGDGLVGVNDTPVCIASIKPATGLASVSLVQRSERWEFNASEHFIYRSDAAGNSLGLIATKTLPASLAVVYEDPVLPFVYLGLSNGALWRYSLITGDLAEFSTSEANTNAVSEVVKVGEFLVVKQGSANARILNSEGESLRFQASATYPGPGDAIRVAVQGGSYQQLATAFDIEWASDRYQTQDASYLSQSSLRSENPDLVLLSAQQGFELSAGQTRLGELVRFRLRSQGAVVQELLIPILDLRKFRFDAESYTPEVSVTLEAEGDLNALSNKRQAADGYEFTVAWFVNGAAESHFKQVLNTSAAPFTLPSARTSLGDIVEARVLLRRANQEHLVHTERHLIVGPFDELMFTANPDTTAGATSPKVALVYEDANNEFLSRYFSIQWLINDRVIEGQTVFEFPNPNLETVPLRWGDRLSYRLKYDYGSNSGEIENRVVYSADITDPSAISVTLGPREAKPDAKFAMAFTTVSDTLDGVLNYAWYVNGKKVEGQEESSYAGPALKSGDELELKVDLINGDENNNVVGRFKASELSRLWVGFDNKTTPEGLDDDGDGVPNRRDYMRFDPACSLVSDGAPDDTDLDKLNDLGEIVFSYPSNSLPNLSDSDGDGLADGFEDRKGSDPRDANSPGFNQNDLDGDGLTNDEEIAQGTQVRVADTDQDGLSDGFEVENSALNYDPTKADSDAIPDGFNDGEDYAFRKKMTRTRVQQGSCYASWLMTAPSLVMTSSDEPQLNDSSVQRAALLGPKGLEVYIYNMRSGVYETSLKTAAITRALIGVDPVAATSLGFERGNLDGLYVGNAQGLVYLANVAEPERAFSGRVFDTQTNQPVTAVLDQGDLLLVETRAIDGMLRHHIFRKDGSALQVPSYSFTAELSYQGAQWGNSSRTTLWLVQNQVEAQPAKVASEVFDLANLSNTTQTALSSASAQLGLMGPMYLRNATGGELAFASGHAYNLQTQAWRSQTERFKFATEIAGHLVRTGRNDKQIYIEDLSRLGAGDKWAYTIPFKGEALALYRQGLDAIILTEVKGPEGQTYLDFERISVGDSDGDGLPGWFESYIAGSADEGLEQIDASQTFDNGGSTYLQAYNAGLDLFEYLNDSDNDGLRDADEPCQGLCRVISDRDYDGLLDGDELQFAYDLDNADTDADGIKDGAEDFDGDGLSNEAELYRFKTDPRQADSDGDGVSDSFELKVLNTKPLQASSNGNDGNVSDGAQDFDGDGLSNAVEEQAGTDPYASDSDGDGLGDLAEISFDGDATSYNPATDLNPSSVDTDADGIEDGVESSLVGANPLIADAQADADGDGLSNLLEARQGSSLSLADTDSDGLSDLQEYQLGTNPNLSDSDGDLVSDAQELAYAGDPSVYERDQDPDPRRFDSDGDGLSDGQELSSEINTNPLLSNSDLGDGSGDLLDDKTEVDYRFVIEDETIAAWLFPENRPNVKANPNLADTDGDGLLDHEEQALGSNIAEADSDNDGLSDAEEKSLGSSLLSRDTDGDGLIDGYETAALLQTLPLDKDSNDNGVSDGDEDFDGDGLSNKYEVEVSRTDPFSADSRGMLYFQAGNQQASSLRYNNNRLAMLNGAVVFDEPVKRLAQVTSEQGGALVDTNGQVVIPSGGYLVLGGNGINDAQEDPDGDGLNNLREASLGTNPYHQDSDGDGLSDDQELNIHQTDPLNPDSDDDGLNDGDEIKFNSDPNNTDTDSDGLSDKDEKERGSEPRDNDSDDDLLADGLESAENINKADADGDGIIDGIEVQLGMDPTNENSDTDRVSDGLEVWAYSFVRGSDGQTAPLHNSRNASRWPALEFSESFAQANPLSHKRQVLKDAAGQDIGWLYVRQLADPLKADSDGDGLADDVELLQVEAKRSAIVGANLADFNFDLVSGDVYPASAQNAELFSFADPLNVDTGSPTATSLVERAQANGINDGLEDFDRDRLVNVDDKQDGDGDVQTILNPDSDANTQTGERDNLLDGIERHVLGTSFSALDSDQDGLNDDQELNAAIVERAIASSESCLADEIRLPNIAGQSYCYKVSYRSYPTQKDSDLDGTNDLEDAFALDKTCRLASDGFDNAGRLQCYSSWLAEQPEVNTVVALNQQTSPPAQSQLSQLALFSKGFDKVVRYDYAQGEAHYLPHIENASNYIDVAYSSSAERLYLLNATGAIDYVDARNYSTGDAVTALANTLPSNGVVREISVVDQGAQHHIVALVENNGQFDWLLYNANGQLTDTETGLDMRLAGSYWHVANQRLYAMVQGPVAEQASTLAYLEIDVANGQFRGPARGAASGILSASPRAPIVLDLDGNALWIGSNERVDLDLNSSLAVLGLQYRKQSYSRFDHARAVAGHRALSVSIDQDDYSERSTGPANAILVQQAAGKNRYLLAPNAANSEVLGIFERASDDLISVRVDQQQTTIEGLGLVDADSDGIIGLYERVFNLDDADEKGDNGRYGDPDGDFLSNVDEFAEATDPRRADTDADGWDDGYEVFNGSDPLDATDF